MDENDGLWQRDWNAHRRERDIETILLEAAAAVGMDPLAMGLDYHPLSQGPGRLLLQEYIDYRLYDRLAHPSDKGRLRFVSERIHWPLCEQCSDTDWNATTQDKWISEVLLREAGLPTPRTVAIVGDTGRRYGRTPCLGTADALGGFLRERTRPLFAKMNGGIGSEGATRIVPLGEGRYDAAGIGQVDAATLFAALSRAPDPYLLQDELTHDSAMAAAFGPRIGTIRAISFVIDGVAHTPVTVLKLPGKDSVADNFWRPGNMLVDLDPETGTVRRLLRGKGPWREILEHHPETGAAMPGLRLPHWQAVRALIAEAGALYAPVKYQSLDIALTPGGPVVVEVNTGSAFNLHQIARGEGFFSDTILDLFRRCGATIDTAAIDAAQG